MAQTVHDVAAAVIERHISIDPLKLQKILFYAAGEYAALTGEAMFPEAIEAWDWGPAIHEIYVTYKDIERARLISMPLKGDSSRLNDLEISCVEVALNNYGECSGAQLIDITHKEAVWKEHYVSGIMRTEIPTSALCSAFREKAKEVEIPTSRLDEVFANAE